MWLAVAAVVAVLTLARLGIVMITVHGVSMEPTLREGDRVLAVRRWLSRGPRRGDIALCQPPPIPGQVFRPGMPTHGPVVVKRIAGVGGDRIVVADHEVTVPAGCVWIRGDHPSSHDSDAYGPVPAGAVLARVLRPRARADR